MSNILDILRIRQEKIVSTQDFLCFKHKNKSWWNKDIKAHFGCVNALAFSHDGQFLASGGDDRRILVWNVGKTLSKNQLKPRKNYEILSGTHESNVFCIDFSCNQVSHFDTIFLRISSLNRKLVQNPEFFLLNQRFAKT